VCIYIYIYIYIKLVNTRIYTYFHLASAFSTSRHSSSISSIVTRCVRYDAFTNYRQLAIARLLSEIYIYIYIYTYTYEAKIADAAPER